MEEKTTQQYEIHYSVDGVKHWRVVTANSMSDALDRLDSSLDQYYMIHATFRLDTDDINIEDSETS